jgi:sulfate permease, SulP family
MLDGARRTAESPRKSVRPPFDWAKFQQDLTPQVLLSVREGYGRERLLKDALAGLTVAILALPLSLAIAIGAGTSPAAGLVTSVVAGFLISALGGSVHQIGGPAAAFIVIIDAAVRRHGFDGLLTATFLAGVILVIAGLLRFGTYIKYIPGPVILGFTSGIGVVIVISQIKDFLGLSGTMPADVVQKIAALWAARGSFNPAAFAIGFATLMTIFSLRRLRPRWPGILIAVVAMSVLAHILGLGVDTIGSRFGAMTPSLPAPAFPSLAWSKIGEVFPTALTIAFLVGVESLLSAVAADTLAGTRHRSNAEVVAQGVANMASPLFGGLPATGVIARTGTNIAAGGTSPIAGMLHAAFVLGFILFLLPLSSYLAMPCLAAVLVSVAWRLLDLGELRYFLARAPLDDRVVLIATLALTVLVDLNVAIAVGFGLAALLFIHRIAEVPGIDRGAGSGILDGHDAQNGQPRVISPDEIPDGAQIIQLRGPLFFGAATQVHAVAQSLIDWPRVLILRMREVPLVDATAVAALEELAETARKRGCRVIISSLQAQPRVALHRLGFLRAHKVLLTRDTAAALARARRLLAG